MKAKEFFGKFASGFLWGNILAMVLVVVALAFGVKYGLDVYTRHGEGIEVPKVEGMVYQNARALMEERGLYLVVTDSGYNKRLPANSILIQNPGPGMKVKQGHTIYVTVNSPSSPSFAIPDLVDNSSFREAEAKLTAIGFKLTPPQQVEGEKDWVYGILCRGRRVSTGDRISIDSPLTLLVGNGHYGAEEEIDYIGSEAQPMQEEGETDEFEEIVE
jgi:beta-lactam-binding protein with PASTA domain